jgi:hypothetical protein
MNILSLAQWDWAGCGFFLSEAINACTEHHSRAVKIEESRFDFPFDIFRPRKQQLGVLIKWAHTIHIHDAFKQPRYKQPVVVTFHGTRYRRAPEAYHKMLAKKSWYGTVATPDLTRFGLPLMPDCRPDLREYHDPPDEFTVVHTPSKRDVKGTERVIEACRRTGVRLTLIEGKPYRECLEIKGRAHVLVDQLELGYGCSAIEAWAMGLPVIADALEEGEQAILDTFEYLPYVKAGFGLESILDRMQIDPGYRQDWADTGRQHYQEWHSYEAAAAKAVHHYETAIGLRRKRASRRSAPIRRGQIKSGELVLVRYLGDSMGIQSWHGPETGYRYKFGIKRPEGYINARDLSFFKGIRDEAEHPLFEVAG